MFIFLFPGVIAGVQALAQNSRFKPSALRAEQDMFVDRGVMENRAGIIKDVIARSF